MTQADSPRSTPPVSGGASSAVRPSASTVRLGSLPANSEQDLRLIQDRLALFGASTFAITVMFLVAVSAADLGFADGQGFSTAPANAFHAIATLIALSIWMLARDRRHFSPLALTALDGFGTVGVCLAFSAMGHFFAQPFGFYTGLLAIIHVNVGRAAVVPSVPRRTLLISALSLSGLVLSRALLELPPDVAAPAALRARWVMEALLWSAAGTGVATLSSFVIYGLHERALEARRLGQYELEEKIGQGGMGEIYRARHAMLRRPTAVKLVSGTGSEERLRRFEREVRQTARLTHPNTISIYDYGRTPDGTFYYAMELLEGLSAEQLGTAHGAQPAARVIHLLEQVSGALAEAHAIGLIHRDIKPANIFLCRRGGQQDVVKVLDFGLVRELDGGSDVTRSNIDVVVGTPLYLSPEAILTPNKVDARADLYGVGGVAYFLLTGRAPFGGRSLVEICSHHLHTLPEPPSRHTPVPADLERVVLRCLAKEPSERPASAGALLAELRGCADAGRWGPAQADLWWAEREREKDAAPPAECDASRDPSRLTVCEIDLKRRLEEQTETA